MGMIRAAAVFAAVLLFAGTASAQDFKKDYIEPQPENASSTVVKVKGGSLIFMAGFTASAPSPDAEAGNFASQVKSAFGKIEKTLKQSGGSLDDIVSLSVFVTDLRYVPEFTKLAGTIFKKGFPATTYVEVSHMARPTLLIEIQPVAAIP